MTRSFIQRLRSRLPSGPLPLHEYRPYCVNAVSLSLEPSTTTSAATMQEQELAAVTGEANMRVWSDVKPLGTNLALR